MEIYFGFDLFIGDEFICVSVKYTVPKGKNAPIDNQVGQHLFFAFFQVSFDLSVSCGLIDQPFMGRSIGLTMAQNKFGYCTCLLESVGKVFVKCNRFEEIFLRFR